MNREVQAPAEASSNLSRDAKRVLQENDTKLKRSKQTRLAYDPANMTAAFEAIRKKQMSVRAAADHFHVPGLTAGKKAKGVGWGVIGSPYVLTEQVEQELADMIRSYCSSKMFWRKNSLTRSLKSMLSSCPAI